MTRSVGVWEIKLSFEDELLPCERVEQRYADRAGFSAVYAVRGVPKLFERNLIKASQVSEVPHTWRVQPCLSEDDVTEEIIIKGKEAIEKDRTELGAHIITYVGDRRGDGLTFEFLAAGAIRNKLNRSFTSNEFPVVSRAIVAPAYRGRGIGSLIVDHRFEAALSFFGNTPKGIHFGTESPKILHSLKKFEQREKISFVHIGDETYTAYDGSHHVTDFLCFLPWYQDRLLAACDKVQKLEGTTASLVQRFKEKLKLFMTDGVTAVRGSELEQLYVQMQQLFGKEIEAKEPLAFLEEIFLVRRAIGASDPV